MKAGYLYYYNSFTQIDQVKELGLDTIILKCWEFHTDTGVQKTLTAIRNWAKASYDNNIRMFVAFNWQPYPYLDQVSYQRTIYRDGTTGLGVSPLDQPHWDHVTTVCQWIAGISKEVGCRVDGIMLDLELYGTEKEPEAKRNYVDCGYEAVSVYKVCAEADLYPYLDKKIEQLADKLRLVVKRLNPSLQWGIYPHPQDNNWFHWPLARGLSLYSNPLNIFGIHSYGYWLDGNGDGYTNIPANLTHRYCRAGICANYHGGYLLRKYNGPTLARNLKATLKDWDGYWLFALRQLDSAQNELIDTPENIKQAIISTNGEF